MDGPAGLVGVVDVAFDQLGELVRIEPGQQRLLRCRQPAFLGSPSFAPLPSGRACSGCAARGLGRMTPSISRIGGSAARRCAQDVVQHLHLRQPRRIVWPGLDLRPRVASLGDAALALFLPPAVAACSFRLRFNLASIGRLPMPARSRGQVAQVLGSPHPGRRAAPWRRKYPQPGRCRPYRARLRRRGRRAAAHRWCGHGRRVDPWRAIGPAHDLGLAGAVLNAFQRIGQRCALKPGRVRQHVRDGGLAHLGVVPGRREMRQQDAGALPLHPRGPTCCRLMPARFAILSAC